MDLNHASETYKVSQNVLRALYKYTRKGLYRQRNTKHTHTSYAKERQPQAITHTASVIQFLVKNTRYTYIKLKVTIGVSPWHGQ